MATNIDIDKLEAGGELDALIAERLFDMKLFTASNDTPAMWHGCLVKSDVYLDTDERFDNFFGYAGPRVEHIRPYSTDITAFWQVVEHLSQTWEIEFRWQPTGWRADRSRWAKFNGLWVAHFTQHDWKSGEENHFERAEFMAPTLPLAGCRAALATVMGKTA